MDNKPNEPNELLSDQTSQNSTNSKKDNPAADLIRKKLSAIYQDEPNFKEEAAEVAEAPKLSKHQVFVQELNASGKDLAAIQTAWHQYYVRLPDSEKHEVWQEFYAANQQSTYQHALESTKTQIAVNPNHSTLRTPDLNDKRRLDTIGEDLKKRVRQSATHKKPSRLRSMAFGLSTGAAVIVIFLFSFFNQIIIAPFIQPSRHVGAAPLIISATTIANSANPEVIIPKINVDIPVNYSLTTDNENTIENALEGGAIHYPSTVDPGQDGNAAFFGHSSNNIFNPGKYKFAFVLLHTLVKGDTFYLTYQKTIYVYQVIDTKIVSPNDVAVLNDTDGQTATATLITCDPPGTSINRLVVTGEQIYPNPDTNSGATVSDLAAPSQLAGNGPSLWSRLWNDIF